MRSGLIFVVACFACSRPTSTFIEKTWPDDQPAVLIFAEENGQPISALLVPAGDVELKELEPIEQPIIVHARVYRSLIDRPSAGDCQVHVGGTLGDPLGAPTLAWRSAPVTLGEDDVVLQADADPAVFDVRVTGCAEPPLSCDVILSFVATGGSHFGLREIASIAPDTAIAAGGQINDVDPKLLVLRVDGERSATLDIDMLNGTAFAVTRHGLNAVIATGRTIVEIDSSGRRIMTATVAVSIAGGATGEDDTVMLIGTDGSLFEIPPNQHAVRSFVAPEYRGPAVDEPRIALSSRDRILVVGPDTRLYEYDGVEWRHELPSTSSFDGVAVDSTSMLAVPTDDQILLREGDGEWRALGPAFLANRAIAAAAIGDGRFFVTGQSGSLAYWNGEALCQPASATSRNLEDVDFFPGTGIGYIAGENQEPGSPPAIFRVEIPR